MSARGRWRLISDAIVRVEVLNGTWYSLQVASHGPPYSWSVHYSGVEAAPLASGSEKSFGRAKQRALDAAHKR